MHGRFLYLLDRLWVQRIIQTWRQLIENEIDSFFAVETIFPNIGVEICRLLTALPFQNCLSQSYQNIYVLVSDT